MRSCLFFPLSVAAIPSCPTTVPAVNIQSRDYVLHLFIFHFHNSVVCKRLLEPLGLLLEDPSIPFFPPPISTFSPDARSPTENVNLTRKYFNRVVLSFPFSPVRLIEFGERLCHQD